MKRLYRVGCALLLCIVCTGILQASADAHVPAEERASAWDQMQETLDKLLHLSGGDQLCAVGDLLRGEDPLANVGKQEGARYTHEAGFSLRVPDGYRIREKYRGATVVFLYEAAQDGFTPTISIDLLGVDEQLMDWTREKVDGMYEKTFTSYKPLSFGKCTQDGVSMLSLSFMEGKREEDQLYFQQLLFNQGKYCYIITMTTAYADRVAARTCFTDLRKSLVFPPPPVMVTPTSKPTSTQDGRSTKHP
ncbi:MAG: hypothetical protein RR482_00700 [Clostridia bacterium]